MRRLLRNKRGQNTLEYALVIAVVVAALIAIDRYIDRSIRGRVRSSIDSIGEQYDAGNVTSAYDISIEAQSNREIFGEAAIGGKGFSHSVTTGGQTTKDGSEQLLRALDAETLYE